MSARRKLPEFQERVERMRSRRRHREIWAAIRAHDALTSAGKRRIRGAGHAARKAGF